MDWRPGTNLRYGFYPRSDNSIRITDLYAYKSTVYRLGVQYKERSDEVEG